MKLQTLFFLVLLPYLAFPQVKNEEDWSEKPPIVTPASDEQPPSDAIVLFDGTDLSNWTSLSGGKVEWKLEDGILIVKPGTEDIITKKEFGDVQLHVEWMVPDKEYGHGNSGVYLQKRYEVQIYNSYKDADKIYYNGQTGSIYKQHTPLVNVQKSRGQWETFDIIFYAPRFDEKGMVLSNARFTVFHNGVLIHHNAELVGTTTHEPETGYEPHPVKQPLLLQEHGDQVWYRNIWLREL